MKGVRVECVAEDNKNLGQGMINSPNVRSKQGEAKAVKDYEVVSCVGLLAKCRHERKITAIISNPKIIYNFLRRAGLRSHIRFPSQPPFVCKFSSHGNLSF